MKGYVVEEAHESESERARTADLMRLTPTGYESVLDAGAREGYYSNLLCERFAAVTALDLNPLKPEHMKGVRCVQGDLTKLPFPDSSFDVVFCSEVLEHVPAVAKACSEIVRVAKHEVLLGVPYRQDIRVGRTTCGSCGRTNFPWGHLNSFDEKIIQKLFHPMRVVQHSYVWTHAEGTNAVASWLMDLAGNPWGVYDSQEPCGHCGKKLFPPTKRSGFQKLCGRAAGVLNRIQQPLIKSRAAWIHVTLKKDSAR
jgi:SAM-dependent methyltransferase